MSNKLSMSRRDFLKTLAVGAAALTPVGSALASTASPGGKPVRARQAEITIRTGGWPIPVIEPADIESDPAKGPQKAAIDTWLEDNPGVELVAVDLPNDRDALMTAIIGGTDASYILGARLGGWSLDGTRSAFAQGFLADCSHLIEEQNLGERILPHIWQSWSTNTSVEGKFFAYPLNQYAPTASTFVYRKDLIEAAGMDEPEIGWTWEYARELFLAMTNKDEEIFGAGFPFWMINARNANYGGDLMTQIPRPDKTWHWERDFMTDPRWVELIEEYQVMLHEEQSVLSDIALGAGDDEYYNLFHAGKIGFVRINYWKMFGGAASDGSLAGFARREGKPYSDLFGIIPMPTGDGYQQGGGVNEWGPVCFSPNDDEATISAAGDLVDWMFFGGGLDITKAGTWSFTEDAQAVYSAFLYMDGREGFEGVPVTPVDAWGQELVDRWVAIGEMPLEPNRGGYFPAEENPGPDNTAIDDQLNLIVAEPDVNVAEAMAEGQANWSQQAEQFESSISAEDFAAAARTYYGELGAYLEANYPDFYANRYTPFMERINEYIG